MLAGSRFEDKRCEIVYHNFKGVDILKDIVCTFNSDKSVLVYFDPDVDGVIAGLLVCRWLRMMGRSFQWCINGNRGHDWSIPMGKLSGLDIIAVDFLIKEEDVRDICDNGANLISMDHHSNGSKVIEYCGSEGKRGIVVNNQYDCEPEDGRYLSGAGVVFEVIRSIMPEFDTLENRALVGITLLSDVRNIENPSARGYLYDLYHHPFKGIIKRFIEATMGEVDYGFGVPRMDRNYVDFKFSPAINACLRFNKQDSVVKFILGQGELNLMYREKQKQIVEYLCDVAMVTRYNALTVVGVNILDCMSYEGIISNFVGLVASKYLNLGKSVLCYLRDGDKVIRASFRGIEDSIDYLSRWREYVKCDGHPPAFGVISMKIDDDLFRKLSEICNNLENENTYVRKVKEVKNLAMFMNSTGNKIAVDNMYCLSRNRTYVKYTGKNIKIRRKGKTYTEYMVDGLQVMCFDNDLNFDTGLILPIKERKVVSFYLES